MPSPAQEGVVHSASPCTRVHRGQLRLRFKDGEVVLVPSRVPRCSSTSCPWTRRQGQRASARSIKELAHPRDRPAVHDTLCRRERQLPPGPGPRLADCYEGAEQMDKDEQVEHGVNFSLTHVDFMVGADDLCITGIKADGEEVPVFVNGAWAWE